MVKGTSDLMLVVIRIIILTAQLEIRGKFLVFCEYQIPIKLTATSSEITLPESSVAIHVQIIVAVASMRVPKSYYV